MLSIREMAVELKLPYIKNNYDMLIDEANHTQMSPKETIDTLLERELLQRRENSKKNRLKAAKFPIKRYMEDFQRDRYDKSFRRKFEELDTLEFIGKKENVILIGNPGCGKTHYATALGIKACMANKTVLFTSVPNLIIELKEAMSKNGLNTYRKKFERYQLVILDELGYVSFDKEGCEILFNLLSNRNDKGSIIITTNLTFDRWEEIFKDPMLTGAIVDRLAHKAHIMDISRETSHRYEETISWMKNSQ
jgi:DNA replication protein DnaC